MRGYSMGLPARTPLAIVSWERIYVGRVENHHTDYLSGKSPLKRRSWWNEIGQLIGHALRAGKDDEREAFPVGPSVLSVVNMNYFRQSRYLELASRGRILQTRWRYSAGSP
jgi:hypothetical protein